MAVISRAELEYAQRDVSDLGKIVNGAADVANPGKPAGTVTTRLGLVVKTLAKVVADGTAVVESLLTPLVYETYAAMMTDKDAVASGVLKVKAGQTCYNRETTQIYILTSVVVEGETIRSWDQVSDLSKAASASFDELLLRSSAVGRMSVDDYEFMRQYDRFLEKDAARRMFIKWPGKSTTGEGLAKVLNGPSAAAWSANPWGQEGVDFGCPTELGPSLKAGNTHPAWTTPARILIKPDTIKEVDGYNIVGIVNVNNAVTEAVHIRNSIIDCQLLYLTPIQTDTQFAPIHVDHCTIRNYAAQGHNLYRGTVRNCLFEISRADGMKGDMLFGGVIYNNLVRRLGQIDLSAHGDAIQCQQSNGMRLIGNTFYMPGTGSTYDEGTYGSTQCLRIVTENNICSHNDLLAVGNLLVGGGYTIAVRSRYSNGETSRVQNVILANNVLGGPTYHLYGHITDEHSDSVSVGIIRNVLFHNNFDIAGNPMSFAGINQNGIWHYSKEHASPLFLELGKRWGYLDWNGDLAPGVISRTEASDATIGTLP